jgi:hypothetical protein
VWVSFVFVVGEEVTEDVRVQSDARNQLWMYTASHRNMAMAESVANDPVVDVKPAVKATGISQCSRLFGPSSSCYLLGEQRRAD